MLLVRRRILHTLQKLENIRIRRDDGRVQRSILLHKTTLLATIISSTIAVAECFFQPYSPRSGIISLSIGVSIRMIIRIRRSSSSKRNRSSLSISVATAAAVANQCCRKSRDSKYAAAFVAAVVRLSAIEHCQQQQQQQ